MRRDPGCAFVGSGLCRAAPEKKQYETRDDLRSTARSKGAQRDPGQGGKVAVAAPQLAKRSTKNSWSASSACSVPLLLRWRRAGR
jgi:hypothetical protein